MKINIRKIESTDISAITRLSEELGYPASEESLQVRFEAIKENPDDEILVAEIPGADVVGWIQVFGCYRLTSEPFAEIGGMVVSKTYRRLGIGKRLLSIALRWSRNKGFKKIRVRSQIQRQEAHSFFKVMGFKVLKTQDVFIKSL
jgi:GNAT superfamily N-acetyltransferase